MQCSRECWDGLSAILGKSSMAPFRSPTFGVMTQHASLSEGANPHGWDQPINQAGADVRRSPQLPWKTCLWLLISAQTHWDGQKATAPVVAPSCAGEPLTHGTLGQL